MPSLLLPRFLLPEMSDKKSPPRKEKPTIVRSLQTDDKGMKRKLLSPGSPTHDDDDKRTPSKRKRGSVSLESSPVPGHLSTPKTPGGGSRSVPLSERQQLAMIMRMSDESAQGALPISDQEVPRKSPSPGVIQPLKKTPLDKKVHKRNERGELPIHLAAIKGDVKLLKKLIKAGADVNVADFAGWTPLHEASNRGWLYVAKQLLKAGANVNVRGLENDTPLHDASINGHRKLVELLLKHGADPLQPNSKGKTPLDVAASQEMVKLLKKEISSSASDSSSIEDIRSPMSPDSINSLKDEERSLDAEDLQNNRSESFSSSSSSNNRKLTMPKSPDNKMASPRLCLKFQRDHLGQVHQKAKDSKEPQYKSYSVTNVSSMDPSLDNQMFSPMDSPASSVDSDLYNPAFDHGTSNSGNMLKMSLPDQDNNGSNSSHNLTLPPFHIDRNHSIAGNHAKSRMNPQELFPEKGVYNRNHNDFNSRHFAEISGSLNNNDVHNNQSVLKHMDTKEFTPHLSLTDSQLHYGNSVSETEMSVPRNIPFRESVSRLPECAANTVDTRECYSVSSSCVSQSMAGHFQSTVTSTTGSNNLILSGSHDGVTDLRDRKSVLNNNSVLTNSDGVTSVCSFVDGSTTLSESKPTELEPTNVTNTKLELRSTTSPNTAEVTTNSDQLSKVDNGIDCEQAVSLTRSDSRDSKESRPSSPKVPPLKIIIPTKSQATSSSDTNDGLKLVVTNVKSALPYVINPYQDQGREAEALGMGADPGVPRTDCPLTMLPISTQSLTNSISVKRDSVEDKVSSEVGGNNSDTTSVAVDLNSSMDVDSVKSQEKLNEQEDLKCDSDSSGSKKDDSGGKKEEVPQRVLRSAVRSQQQSEPKPNKQQKQVEKPEKNNQADSTGVSEAAPISVQRSSSKDEDYMNIHPRKRKIRPKSENNNISTSTPDSPLSVTSGCQNDRVPNPYELYFALRKKIASRRQGYLGMVNICPKTPQGFKDYLLKTCNYVLQGNATSTLSVPTLSPPNSVKDKMRDLFVQQEEVRYKLRLQHLIEREKLILSIEQEILREHGRAARATISQGTPLSACTILRDEEIYNITDSDPEEKDKKNRTRYNGRQFLSWIQDVDDKYEKIKELLILRQKQEADSLYAIQKLEWEWRLKDLGQCERNTVPDIDELHVPLVQVTDNFDLLPT